MSVTEGLFLSPDGPSCHEVLEISEDIKLSNNQKSDQEPAETERDQFMEAQVHLKKKNMCPVPPEFVCVCVYLYHCVVKKYTKSDLSQHFFQSDT